MMKMSQLCYRNYQTNITYPETESSETKGDLDIELKEIAEDNGINFFRVPIPHDDVRFTNILSDLVENLLRTEPVMGELGLRRCLCRKTPETFCLNATSGDNP